MAAALQSLITESTDSSSILPLKNKGELPEGHLQPVAVQSIGFDKQYKEMLSSFTKH